MTIWRQPDWICPQCTFTNLAICGRCRNCDAAKPPAHPKTPDLSTQEESQPKENKPPAVTFMLELTREELCLVAAMAAYLELHPRLSGNRSVSRDPMINIQAKVKALLGI